MPSDAAVGAGEPIKGALDSYILFINIISSFLSRVNKADCCVNINNEGIQNHRCLNDENRLPVRAHNS